MLNLVAFVTDEKDWPSDTHLTLPATIEEAVKDFEDFGPNVLNLIQLAKNKPDRVSDHLDMINLRYMRTDHLLSGVSSTLLIIPFQHIAVDESAWLAMLLTQAHLITVLVQVLG
jgi:hypothetical protein